MKIGIITVAFTMVSFISSGCSGNSEKAPSICETPVIVMGGKPSCQALADFNDARHEYNGKLLYVIPTGEGYKILHETINHVDGSCDVFEFVSKKLNPPELPPPYKP